MNATATHLSPDDRDTLRRMLEAEAARLRLDINQDRHQLDGSAGTLPPAFDDGRDEPTVDVMRDLDVAELQRRTTALAAIEAAIGRITANTYGLCVQCGDAISVQRLRAAPASARCIRCQSSAERSQPHIASL